PIGAIANPGLDALTAALKPNDTPYYFFVTDIEFTHYYGKTWNEHLNNIEKAKAVNRTYGKNGL
ncbi:MAG: endolytic transglycosylase MltG, partial [Angelakisella sp.]